MPKRIVLGVSGSSGAIYGVRTLEALREAGDWEVHLVLSRPAELTIVHETGRAVSDICKLAHQVYDVENVAASISSGSFQTEGMIVAPCSIKTLSAIANCYTSNLLHRAADVTLKERRPLVLLVRETPLHLGHLRLMTSASEYGAVIMPPVPAFYHHPKTIDDVVNQTVGRVLDHFRIPHQLGKRWTGM